jgi:hypothetical protein
MPLIYGEGSKAFRRLQEEIIRRSNDLTILAWAKEDLPDASDPHGNDFGLFSPSPAAFIRSSDVERTKQYFDFSVTNLGFRISNQVFLKPYPISGENCAGTYRYLLCVGLNDEPVYIFLLKAAPNIFYRDHDLRPQQRPDFQHLTAIINDVMPEQTDCSILAEPRKTFNKFDASNLAVPIHIPYDPTIRVRDAVPRSLWNWTEQIFFTPQSSGLFYPMALAIGFSVHLPTGVHDFSTICDYRAVVPQWKILESRPGSPRLLTLNQLFNSHNAQQSINWDVLEERGVVIQNLNNHKEVIIDGKIYKIEVSDFWGPEEISCLAFKVYEYRGMRHHKESWHCIHQSPLKVTSELLLAHRARPESAGDIQASDRSDLPK